MYCTILPMVTLWYQNVFLFTCTLWAKSAWIWLIAFTNRQQWGSVIYFLNEKIYIAQPLWTHQWCINITKVNLRNSWRVLKYPYPGPLYTKNMDKISPIKNLRRSDDLLRFITGIPIPIYQDVVFLESKDPGLSLYRCSIMQTNSKPAIFYDQKWCHPLGIFVKTCIELFTITPSN